MRNILAACWRPRWCWFSSLKFGRRSGHCFFSEGLDFPALGHTCGIGLHYITQLSTKDASYKRPKSLRRREVAWAPFSAAKVCTRRC